MNESGLEAITELGTGALKVSWNSYQNPDIYYRVEIFSKKMDLTQPYFVSRIQPATSTGMTINTTTSGEVNRIGELIKGESYRVRLTALMFEPGVDVINDEYSSAIRERGNNRIECGPAEEAGLRVSGELLPELSFAGPSGNNIGWLRLFFPVNSPNVRLL